MNYPLLIGLGVILFALKKSGNAMSPESFSVLTEMPITDDEIPVSGLMDNNETKIRLINPSEQYPDYPVYPLNVGEKAYLNSAINSIDWSCFDNIGTIGGRIFNSQDAKELFIANANVMIINRRNVIDACDYALNLLKPIILFANIPYEAKKERFGKRLLNGFKKFLGIAKTVVTPIPGVGTIAGAAIGATEGTINAIENEVNS